MYAQECKGVCPQHFQQPSGKTLNISFIGLPPFVTYNPRGGSAFILMAMLANKYGFIPNYIQAKSMKQHENAVCISVIYKICNEKILQLKYSYKFQVSLKQSELGIFQITFEDYRLMLIDYLPHMYTIEFYLNSQKPRSTTTYDTIVIPFDKYVWTFMIVCICTQFLLLVLMQQLYNNATGTENQDNLQYLYEGNIWNNITF